MDKPVNEGKEILYIALIVYEASSDAPNYQPLYEESFVLIKAYSQEEALQKAVHCARRRETVYQNEYQETISWTLKQIVDVAPTLTESIECEDEAELYARHFRDYRAYIAFEPLLSGKL